MPRNLSRQAVVITGASSGLGREIALRFAEKGSRLMLLARREDALAEVARECRERGAQQVEYMPVDVSDPDQVFAAARRAAELYRRIDTWINNAGTSIYAPFFEQTPQEVSRLLEVNFLSVVWGTQAAYSLMRDVRRGVIINVGSIESLSGVPLSSTYSASKHAIQGFTESVRRELMAVNPGIKICIIYPASMNTPLFQHARSKMGVMAAPLPPVYDPGRYAGAVLQLAQRPTPTRMVGLTARNFVFMQRFLPWLMDIFMARKGFELQQSDLVKLDDEDNLFTPMEAGQEAKAQWNSLGKPGAPIPGTAPVEETPGAAAPLEAAPSLAGDANVH